MHNPFLLFLFSDNINGILDAFTNPFLLIILILASIISTVSS